MSAEFGWIDNQGELRPRSWEEYCKYFRKIPAPQGWEHKPQTWTEYCRMVRSAPDWPSVQMLMNRYGAQFNQPPLRIAPLASNAPRVKPTAKSELVKAQTARRPVYDPPRENNRTLRNKRRRLLARDPHCFWCGCLVVETLSRSSNQATIDHLYSRLNPHRPKRHSEGRAVLHVLACYACNNSRADAEIEGRPFIPKLPGRLETARLACAVNPVDVAIPAPPPIPQQVAERKSPMRIIQTIEEAIAFARENPAR